MPAIGNNLPTTQMGKPMNNDKMMIEELETRFEMEAPMAVDSECTSTCSPAEQP